MPRHLISDAHEWINEIPTGPIYYLAKPQPSNFVKRHKRCTIGGSFGTGEISLLSSFLYLFDEAELGLAANLLDLRSSLRADPSRRQCQEGGLAGAAHLSNDNAGVLRQAQ